MRIPGFGKLLLLREQRIWRKNNRINTRIMNVGIPDQFVTHGSPETLMSMLGIDEKSIAQKIKAELNAMEGNR